MQGLIRRVITLVIAALLAIGTLGLLSEAWYFNVQLAYRTGDLYDVILCRHSVVWTAGKDDLVHLMFKPGERQYRLNWNAYSVSRAKITRREWWPTSTAGRWSAQREVVLPIWWAAPLGLLLLGIRVLVRRLQRKPHECRGCRYDIRGLPTGSVVCPECGTAIPAGSKNATDPAPVGTSAGKG